MKMMSLKQKEKEASSGCSEVFPLETGEEAGVLHQVSMYDADTNLRMMITELNDAQLLTRIVGGDLIAMEAKHHLKCQINLQNRYRSLIRMSNQETAADTCEKMNESRAFVELTSYIEEAVGSGILLFKLSEIHSMYVNRLEDLGINKQVNKTKLKKNLLEHGGKNSSYLQQRYVKYVEGGTKETRFLRRCCYSCKACCHYPKRHFRPSKL